MRRFIISRWLLVLAASAAVTSFPGGAVAKGIESASVDGPGLEAPIDIGSGDDSLAELFELTGVGHTIPIGEGSPLHREAPADERLGPRYEITWRARTGPDEVTEVCQHLYPFAQRGPLVQTPAGQRIYGGSVRSGWYRAPAALCQLLRDLGVPDGVGKQCAPPGQPTSPAGQAAARHVRAG